MNAKHMVIAATKAFLMQGQRRGEAPKVVFGIIACLILAGACSYL